MPEPDHHDRDIEQAGEAALLRAAALVVTRWGAKDSDVAKLWGHA